MSIKYKKKRGVMNKILAMVVTYLTTIVNVR